MIAGAKITETMTSAMSNPARMKIARSSGESPLRVPFDKARTPPRTFPIRAGGVGLPIVSGDVRLLFLKRRGERHRIANGRRHLNVMRSQDPGQPVPEQG